jgi:DNA-binding response OmpR family regulator
MIKILVIEDDQELLRTLLRYLDTFGYICEKAKLYTDAKQKIETFKYDCIILDINLPDGNGLALIDLVKSINDKCGIVVLSANNSLDDTLHGLDTGADDYLTKPFHLAELNARVRAVVRRHKYGGNNKLTFNEIVVNTSSNEVHVNGDKLKLTKKEFELLLFLMSNKDKVVTKQSISDFIWGDYIEFENSFDFIYSHLKNLRKKINDKGGKDYIQTVYGIGYRFSE